MFKYAGIRWNLIKKSDEASLWTYANCTRNEHRTYVQLMSNLFITYSRRNIMYACISV